MQSNRVTQGLLAVVVGVLGIIAFRPSPPAAAAGPSAEAASGVSGLQVSADAGGLIAFDASTGEILRLTIGEKKGVESLGILKRRAGGGWEFGAREAADVKIDAARLTTTKSDVTLLRTALNGFRADTGRYPSTEEGLQVLIVQPGGVDNWKGPYLKAGVPQDPWGNPYIYRFDAAGPAGAPELKSFGPDRVDGGGDDVLVP